MSSFSYEQLASPSQAGELSGAAEVLRRAAEVIKDELVTALPAQPEQPTVEVIDATPDISEARKSVEAAVGLLDSETDADRGVTVASLVSMTMSETVTLGGLYPDAGVVSSTPITANRTAVISHEKAHKPRITHRAATIDDVDTLVAIDMAAFSGVYENYDQDPKSLEAELREKFAGRIEKVGGRWIRICEVDGVPSGFIMACPTSKSPNDFESWEKTTDNGTLETTYDPDGRNAYVVSLSVLPAASKQRGHDMMIAHMMGEFMEAGMELAYFESRMPGLRNWVEDRCEEEGRDISTLTEADKTAFALHYFGLKAEVRGREVPLDRLLRLYERMGCRFTKVVPNAYKDEESMDFGVVAVFDNPLPRAVRTNPIVRTIAGKAAKVVAKSHWLVKKVM